MAPKNQVRRGQLWKNKVTGKLVEVMGKATGNRHWTLDNGHHVHEGTLLKFYVLLGSGGRPASDGEHLMKETA